MSAVFLYVRPFHHYCSSQLSAAMCSVKNYVSRYVVPTLICTRYTFESAQNYGLMKTISSEQIKHLPWLTRHMVNHYIATHPDGQRIGTVVVTNINNETVVSGLTDSLPVARAMRADAVVT
jgi:hypothetical protein